MKGDVTQEGFMSGDTKVCGDAKAQLQHSPGALSQLGQRAAFKEDVARLVMSAMNGAIGDVFGAMAPGERAISGVNGFEVVWEEELTR